MCDIFLQTFPRLGTQKDVPAQYWWDEVGIKKALVFTGPCQACEIWE